MPLQDLLSRDRIAIIDAPADRFGVIDEAAGLLAGHGGDAALANAIRTSLRSREQLASTGIGHGVAIPHGRVAGLEAGRGALLRLSSPVDFAAVDGEPVDLVLAMAVPEHSVQLHLQQLAELAEHFADPGFREQLRSAADADELSRRLLDPAHRRSVA